MAYLGVFTPATASTFGADSQANVIVSEGDQGSVSQVMRGADGLEYLIVWDKTTDRIEFQRGGKVVGSTTMAEVRAKYLKAQGEARYAVGAANSCDYTMAGVSTAHGILWTAAGLTAVAPPAAMVAGVAGVVTTGILTAGALAAC